MDEGDPEDREARETRTDPEPKSACSGFLSFAIFFVLGFVIYLILFRNFNVNRKSYIKER